MSAFTESTLNEEVEILQQVLSVLTRELLHHPEYVTRGTALLGDKVHLYKVLSDIFVKWIERMQQVETYAVNKEELSALLEWCFMELQNTIHKLCEEKEPIDFCKSTTIENVEESCHTSKCIVTTKTIVSFINAAPFVSVDNVVAEYLTRHNKQQRSELIRLCKVLQNKYNNNRHHLEFIKCTPLELEEQQQRQQSNVLEEYNVAISESDNINTKSKSGNSIDNDNNNVSNKVNILIVVSAICSLLPSLSIASTLESITSLVEHVLEKKNNNKVTVVLVQRVLAAIVYIWSCTREHTICKEHNNDNESTIECSSNSNNCISKEEEKEETVNNNNNNSESSDQNVLEVIARHLFDLHHTDNNIAIQEENYCLQEKKNAFVGMECKLTLSEQVCELLNANCCQQGNQELDHYLILPETCTFTQNKFESKLLLTGVDNKTHSLTSCRRDNIYVSKAQCVEIHSNDNNDDDDKDDDDDDDDDDEDNDNNKCECSTEINRFWRDLMSEELEKKLLQ